MLKGLLRQYDDDQLVAYAVSTAVNRAGFNSPELIEPVESKNL
jgi:putative SOS response-associated peptidase YedK